MPSITSNATFTLAKGSSVIFELGGSGTATVAGQIYSIGNREAFIGPFDRAVSVVVSVENAPIGYRIDGDGDLADQKPEIAAINEQALKLTASGLSVGGQALNPEQRREVQGIPRVSIVDLGFVSGGTVAASSVQAAVDAAIALGAEIYIPPGEFTVTGGISASSTKSARFFGEGMDASILKFQGLGSSAAIEFDFLQNLRLDGFRVTSADNSGSAGIKFQHTGPTTSVRHRFENLHISNFIAGTGLIVNNVELSKFSQLYIYGCLDGFLGNNTGNGSGSSASCISNIIEQTRMLFCSRKGMELANWGNSLISFPQALQCGVTVAGDGTYTLTAGQTAQISILGSCHSITVDHPDIEEYRFDGETQVFTQLTTGVQFSGTNHQLITPNLVGLSYPWKAVSANDFLVISPRIISCANNGAQDAASLRTVAIIPRQMTASGQAVLIGSGGSGYTGSPAAVSATGTTITARLPKLTTAQRNALTGAASGDEIYNTTLNKKEFYNGTAWETITSA